MGNHENSDENASSTIGGVSRRKFLGSAGSAAALTTITGASTASAADASTRPSPSSKYSIPLLNVPGAARVGATVLPQGSNTRLQQANIFDNVVGRPLASACQKVYFGQGEFPTSSQAVADLTGLGCKVLLCYKPQPGGSDLSSLMNSINGLNDSIPNLNAGVVLWQEVQNQSNNITASQYKKMITTDYGPSVRTVFPLYYDASPNGANHEEDEINYFPGGQYVDVTAIDLYANQYWNQGYTLDTIQSLADSAPSTPLGILEFGITANGSGTLTDIQILAFYDYIMSTMSTRLANGKKNGSICYYDGGGLNDITTSNDYRVTTLQAMSDTLSGQATVQE